jgi:flagellar motility protein MotE (MotC chaperone)
MNRNARRAGVLRASCRAAAPAALALVLMAATPALANDETIFSGLMTALNPIARAWREEPPAVQPEAETKAAPPNRDPRPVAIAPRASPRLAVARPAKPRPARETAMLPDPTVTGAIAQAPSPAQPVQEPQPRPPAAPAAAATAPPAKTKPDATPKPKADAAAKPAPKPAAPASAAAEPGADGEAAQFCRNISDAASDARFSWQVRVLEQLDKQVKESVDRLEIKRAEYEDWLKRREDFLKKVEDGVVEMYGRMRPEAAAPQIASMTEEVALSVLMKLKPRVSSAILSEMEPARAARLTDSLAGVRLTTREQGKTP